MALDTSGLSGLLAQIRQRESGGRYDIPPTSNYAYPASHASGAYQFEPGTWKLWTMRSGIGQEYPEAYLAPPDVQDKVATFAASRVNPNSQALWGASAPRGGYPAATPDAPPAPAPAPAPAPTDVAEVQRQFPLPPSWLTGLTSMLPNQPASLADAFIRAARQGQNTT